MDKKSSNIIWVTWESQRRSIVLSEQFGTKLFIFDEKFSNRLIRYFKLSCRTINILFKQKPKLIFCQNPSIVLASLLCLLKNYLDFYLIVDRHSNFKFDTERSYSPIWLFFHALSNFTLRKANLTIVTNYPLAQIVEKKGGNAFVLPDKIPNLNKPSSIMKLEGEFNFLFICTFSNDEPVDVVLDAFNSLSTEYHLYVTSDYRKYRKLNNYLKCKNIHFLGYLSETDYIKYLYSCDATIVLTTARLTLNCGSYESIAAGKLQIVAGSEEIKSYFNKCCVYINSFSEDDIKSAVKEVRRKYNNRIIEEVHEFKKELDADWYERFEELKKKINSIKILI